MGILKFSPFCTVIFVNLEWIISNVEYSNLFLKHFSSLFFPGVCRFFFLGYDLCVVVLFTSICVIPSRLGSRCLFVLLLDLNFPGFNLIRQFIKSFCYSWIFSPERLYVIFGFQLKNFIHKAFNRNRFFIPKGVFRPKLLLVIRSFFALETFGRGRYLFITSFQS